MAIVEGPAMTQEEIYDVDVNSYNRDDIDDIDLRFVNPTDWSPHVRANSPRIRVNTIPRSFVSIDEGILKWFQDTNHPMFGYLDRMCRIWLVDLAEMMIFRHLQLNALPRNTFIIGFVQVTDGYHYERQEFYTTSFPCYNKLRDMNCVQIATFPMGSANALFREMQYVQEKLITRLHGHVELTVIKQDAVPTPRGLHPTQYHRIKHVRPSDLLRNGQITDVVSYLI
ncbi:uncharacterized protein LOC106056222 [Biomphalaria glabrata]|uniref:Uncharacterized protein LOC106056222 n=1 Tax=Biomphalaria glabrata TaxID=6526 RepID=A0A9W2YHL4_BIOGL|nr:uncharacterized protein LOC106056222 [Biomphalaria glabrata]